MSLHFSIGETLDGSVLDAVLCVAGGWASGGAGSKNMIKNADMLWKQSVWTSAISARIAALHLKKGGLLQLTGAAPVSIFTFEELKSEKLFYKSKGI